MRLVLHTLILGNVLFERAAFVGCAPQRMGSLLCSNNHVLLCFFLFSVLLACFAFFRFLFSYSCTTSPLNCFLLIRYMYLLDELRSAQCLSDIGGWHHRYFFL